MAGLKPLLKDIADAIRSRSGTTAAISASEFADKIGRLRNVTGNGISVWGGLYSGVTDQFRTGFYVGEQSGGVATFDGKTLRIPMTIELNSADFASSNFDIIVSFE